MTQGPSFDSVFFRAALGRFATGVTVISSETQSGEPIGLTVSSFNSVSLDPPLILWSLAKKSASLAHLRASAGYVIHVLSAQQLPLARRFAYGPQADRFAGHPITYSPGGLLMLDTDQCSAWFACRHYAQYEAGDHLIFVGQVEDCQHYLHQPLIYHAGDFDLTPNNSPWPGT